MSTAERIHDLIGEEEDCLYLPGERARMEYKIVAGCSAATYQRLLESGWRRFGRVIFRPICAACRECRSLRVDVAAFRPNRSMRRTLARNRDLQVMLGRPRIDDERLDLYHRYHEDQHRRRGWTERRLSAADYHASFVAGYEEFGHELTVRDGDRLLAVALVDLLPRALSAVYCYYDPAERRRALGVLAVLREVALARRLEVPYLYLGFLIDGNASMRYKARYRPYQVLRGRPAEDEPPEWVSDAGS